MKNPGEQKDSPYWKPLKVNLIILTAYSLLSVIIALIKSGEQEEMLGACFFVGYLIAVQFIINIFIFFIALFVRVDKVVIYEIHLGEILAKRA